ncbi:extensin family protein [Aureimonas sp. AU12]|uniref:extensin family protein n=1 Tax=Aureimonas sp. AU12 TaxID=1638161 RepID=UPI000A8896C8|nr:extensin family protein [Aureimonas sp. AU12]
MVSRKTGWRIVTLAAAVYAAAGADGPFHPAAARGPIPPADIPNVASRPPEGRAKPGRSPTRREPSVRREAPAREPAPSRYEAPPQPAPGGGNLVWGGPLPTDDMGYVPSPAYGEAPARRGGGLAAPPVAREPEPAMAEPAPPSAEPDAGVAETAPAFEAEEPPVDPGPGQYGRTYPVQELRPQVRGSAEPAGEPPGAPLVREASLPTLGPPVVVDDGGAGYGAEPDADFDPWEGLTEAEPEPEVAPAPRQAPPRESRRLASLPATAPPTSRGGLDARPGRGTLEAEVPEGYRPLAKSEALCRRELKRLGVVYRDVSRVASGGSCGIDHPVRISQAVSGIAMSPPAVMNCQAALKVARWLKDDVKPAARWKLWKRPTALINASSYRCSRIAGSRTISEHASGNALDVGGFRFADSSVVKVEPKGAFSFRERAFQTAIRQGSCRHFGTVLGPGYNRAHADHLHLDVKTRLLPICK